MQESNESVDLIVGEKYHQLYCKNKYLLECIEKEKYLDLSKELVDNSPQEVISSVEKELSIIELDIREKLKMINLFVCPP